MFSTVDSYGNKVICPGDCGKATTHLKHHRDGQYAVIENGKVISDGIVLCSTGANAPEDALAFGLFPVCV
jgi:hypothetical protein